MSKPVRVLVVDDDPVFLSLMEAFLSHLNCVSFFMQDSRQAFQFLTDNDVRSFAKARMF
jgi:CheY-like chemotaxis protein